MPAKSKQTRYCFLTKNVIESQTDVDQHLNVFLYTEYFKELSKEGWKIVETFCVPAATGYRDGTASIVVRLEK